MKISMKNLLDPRQIKMMIPYFFLALAIIVAFRVVSEFRIFIALGLRIWEIFVPFFYGFLLAYILSMPVSALQKLIGKCRVEFILKRKKGISIVSVYLLFIFLIYLLVNLVVPYISSSIELFIANSQSYYESFLSFIDYINDLNILNEPINVETLFSDLLAILAPLVDVSLPFDAIFGFTATLFRSFLAFVSSIYILFEKDKFKAFMSRVIGLIFSAFTAETILKYSTKANKYFKRYIYTQTIDGIILGTAVGIQLHLLGSPFALTLGIILGIINYIPYFGSIVGTIIAIVIVLLTQGPSIALIASITLIITQQLDGNVLQPKLMGESFKMSPLLIIISITVGGAFAGVFGMIAAIPIVAILRDTLTDFFAYLENKKQNEMRERDDEHYGL